MSLMATDLPCLRTYTEKVLQVLRRVMTLASHGKLSADLDFYVVMGIGPNLLGRDSLEKLKLE